MSLDEPSPDLPPDPAAGAARPYHHGGLREALIAAGLAILEEEGLEGLSLRAIAARAGVSHAAPRRHFPSLRALLTAIAAEGFRRHAAAMREGVGEGTPRRGRLEAAFRGYAAFAEAHPALYALMFSPLLVDHADAELGQAGAASYAVLRDIARDLDWPAPEGPDRQAQTEAMLWSLVHGHALLARAGLLGGGPGCDPPPVESVLPRWGYLGPEAEPSDEVPPPPFKGR